MKRKQIIFGSFILAVCVLGAVALFIFKPSTAKANFQIYKPSVLPAGVQLAGGELSPGNSNDSVGTPTTYRWSTDRGISIVENNSGRIGIINTCVGWDPTATRCTEPTTPKGQKFTLVKSLDQNGKLFDIQLGWTRGDTRFFISVEQAQVPTYAEYDWSAVVDSFEPVNLPE